jgi:hypothetical protein
VLHRQEDVRRTLSLVAAVYVRWMEELTERCWDLS